jgi:hypothetical protein
VSSRRQEAESAALDCANTAISRDADTEMAPPNQSTEVVPQSSEADISTEPVEVVIPFSEVKPYVPE